MLGLTFSLVESSSALTGSSDSGHPEWSPISILHRDCCFGDIISTMLWVGQNLSDDRHFLPAITEPSVPGLVTSGERIERFK